LVLVPVLLLLVPLLVLPLLALVPLFLAHFVQRPIPLLLLHSLRH
jgi:hypothetical protein